MQIKRKDIRAEREPQSESEESKLELDFEKAILKEARQFILAVEELSVAKEGDLMSLREMLERQKGEIE